MTNRVFADTSALYAHLVANDTNHARATRALKKLAHDQAVLVTSSYVLVETYALLARRVGMEAVERFRSDVAPLLEVVWIDQPLHEQALDLLSERQARDLSLVDAASFVVMREQRLDEVLAFDKHFEREGFRLRH